MNKVHITATVKYKLTPPPVSIEDEAREIAMKASDAFDHRIFKERIPQWTIAPLGNQDGAKDLGSDQQNDDDEK